MNTGSNDDADRGSSPGTTPLRRNRDFLLLWSSQAASVLGSQISGIAYPLLVLAITGSAARAGIVAAAFSLPQLLLYLHAGVLVDRTNRKHIMLASDAISVLSAASLVGALLLDRLTFPHIVIVAFVHGVSYVVFGLAELAAIRRVVPPAQLGEALARNESRAFAALLIGPPIGGALFTLGRSVPFLVDAISYLFSFAAIKAIKSELQEQRAPSPQRVRAEIREGITWLWNRAFLRYSVFFVGALNLVVNSVALLVIIHARSHGVNPALIGTMLSAFGVGGLIGSLAAPKVQRSLSTRVVVLGILWLDALFIVLLAPSTHPLILGSLFAAIGVLGPIWNVVVTGYRVLLVPDRLQGRVNSAAKLVALGPMPLGYVLAGLAADALGSAEAIIAFGAAMAIVALTGTAIPSVRHAEDLRKLLAEHDAQGPAPA